MRLCACCRQQGKKQEKRCLPFQLQIRRKPIVYYGAALMGSGRSSAGDLSCGQGSPSCWRRLLLLFWACGRSGPLLFISAHVKDTLSRASEAIPPSPQGSFTELHTEPYDCSAEGYELPLQAGPMAWRATEILRGQVSFWEHLAGCLPDAAQRSLALAGPTPSAAATPGNTLLQGPAEDI